MTTKIFNFCPLFSDFSQIPPYGCLIHPSAPLFWQFCLSPIDASSFVLYNCNKL